MSTICRLSSESCLPPALRCDFPLNHREYLTENRESRFPANGARFETILIPLASRWLIPSRNEPFWSARFTSYYNVPVSPGSATLWDLCPTDEELSEGIALYWETPSFRETTMIESQKVCWCFEWNSLIELKVWKFIIRCNLSIFHLWI